MLKVEWLCDMFLSIFVVNMMLVIIISLIVDGKQR